MRRLILALALLSFGVLSSCRRDDDRTCTSYPVPGATTEAGGYEFPSADYICR